MYHLPRTNAGVVVAVVVGIAFVVVPRQQLLLPWRQPHCAWPEAATWCCPENLPTAGRRQPTFDSNCRLPLQHAGAVSYRLQQHGWERAAAGAAAEGSICTFFVC